MSARINVGRPKFLENEGAAAGETETNSSRDYANWGGEFVDDALRFGEQLFLGGDDRLAGTRQIAFTQHSEG